VGVPLQEELDVFDAGCAVSIDIRHLVDLDNDGLRLWALSVAFDILLECELCASDGGAVVTGRNQLPEAKFIEVGGEVLEKIAFEWIVAVAVDDLAAEGVRVELEVGLDLFLDIGVLRVELILLRRLRGVQASIHRPIYSCRWP